MEDQVERLYLQPDLGAARDPPIRAGRCKVWSSVVELLPHGWMDDDLIPALTLLRHRGVSDMRALLALWRSPDKNSDALFVTL